MMEWLLNNYIEVLGALTGLIYLYLEIRQKIWLWPLGIVTSAFYIYIFFDSKFYADMGLQFYYLAISIYGWHKWLRGVGEGGKELLVTNITRKLILRLALASVVIFAFLAFILIQFTDSPVPYGDSFTTALSIVATWMLTHKILQMWWLWMVVNLVSLILYIHKGLYPTSVLFLFYFAMSVVGYLQWKRSMGRTKDLAANN